MVEPKEFISGLREILRTAFALVGAIGTALTITTAIVNQVQRPEIVYSTKELTAYPLMPADIQGRVLANGPVKILELVVQNKGKRSASDVLVRIPSTADDKYLGGWMTKSEAPSTVYMLGSAAEHKLEKLLPGDTVSFSLCLKNVRSDLASRVQVFDGDGRRATSYRYVSVRYLGSDAVIIPIGRRFINLLGVMMAVILLLSVLRIVKFNQPRIPPDGQHLTNACEHPPVTSPDSTARAQRSRDPPPSRRKVGG